MFLKFTIVNLNSISYSTMFSTMTVTDLVGLSNFTRCLTGLCFWHKLLCTRGMLQAAWIQHIKKSEIWTQFDENIHIFGFRTCTCHFWAILHWYKSILFHTETYFNFHNMPVSCFHIGAVFEILKSLNLNFILVDSTPPHPPSTYTHSPHVWQRMMCVHMDAVCWHLHLHAHQMQ